MKLNFTLRAAFGSLSPLRSNAYKLKTLSSTDCTDFRRLDGEKCFLLPDQTSATENSLRLPLARLKPYELKISFLSR